MTEFKFDKIDVGEVGKFILLSMAQFESRDSKDILIFMKNYKVSHIFKI